MQGSVRYTVFESSGALRVENPEELRDLAALEIRPSKSGYLHVYIANTSARAVNWDELAITRLRGQVLEINHYYPYGLQLFGIDNEGRSYPYKYGSKELQQDAWARQMVLGGDFINLDWLDFEARMYACPEQTVRRPCGCRRDPTVARWYNPDPAEQFMNPYLAIGNSPTMYVDPDGEFAFVPLLVGMATGALIGAGTSAAMYSAQAGAEGSWNWNDFGKTAAIGALGGALGGGLGNLGAQLAKGGIAFGQSLGYNMLSNVASNSATTLAFGGDVSLGSAAGMAFGGFLGAGMGNFQGVSGSAMKNIGAELGFGAFKGAVTGAYGGMIGAAIDGTDPGQGFINGARNGAIAGATVAGLNIAAMGAAYKPDREYGDFGSNSPVYRRGHFLWPKTTGLALGRNLVTRQTGDQFFDDYLRAHETGHYVQQSKLGFANFYKRVLGEYRNDGQLATYELGGRLEFGAQIYSLNQIGYFWSDQFGTYINNSNYNYFYPNVPKSIY